MRRLRVEFPPPRDWPWARHGSVQAVEDVHFDLAPGETLGILGEAGCGKTTLARALAGLQAVNTGGIVLGDRDLARTAGGWKPARRRIQMLAADARDSLDPRFTAVQCVLEPLEALRPDLDAAARESLALATLAELSAGELGGRKPPELSDDECRSVCLARALAVDPDVLVCDEPATALGAPAREDLLERLRSRQRERGLAVVFTAAEPQLLAPLCERLLVMSLGRVLEQGAALEMLADPRHPYTRALVGGTLEGENPDPSNPPSGCVFRTRCAMADELCARETPYLRRVSEGGHAACHYVHGTADAESVGEARVRR